MTMRTKTLALGMGLLTGSVASVLAYEVFDWALIRYWESQHQGRRMMFTFWADFRALPLAALTFVGVLYLTCRSVQRRSKSDPSV